MRAPVAFLLADGVFPSNEGRGYVLRRILRRAVRHAYLLGRREADARARRPDRDRHDGRRLPGAAAARRASAADDARRGAGVPRDDRGWARAVRAARPAEATDKGTISGEDAFRLYDTFGFPIDLTELMAQERGYTVDIAGFEQSLSEQRTRSKDERKARKLGVEADALGELASWERASAARAESSFVGYDTVEVETDVVALRRMDGGRVAVLLKESPFYAESGGQISDEGEIVGDGWRIEVTACARSRAAPRRWAG
jgi:alanyl-tRNA synthetase